MSQDKTSQPGNVQIQNVPLHKVPPIKRPNSKMFQLQNVPSLKTTQPQNVPTPKRTNPQNVPGPKASQAPKSPNAKMSRPKTSQASECPNLQGKNFFYFINKDDPHRDVGRCQITIVDNTVCILHSNVSNRDLYCYYVLLLY
jgi:hypothetical protein